MRIEILGAPVDVGADRRGVDMGPSAIRYAELIPKLRALGHEVVDLGNIPPVLPESASIGSTSAKYLTEIVAMSELVRDSVQDVISRESFPLVLGGDHSVSLGSIAGLRGKESVGVIWIDAHGDFNTPDTSPSGNVHGMILGALAGYGDERMTTIAGDSPAIDSSQIALIGTRELDAGERQTLHASETAVFTMADIDRQGIATVVDDVLRKLRERVGHIHLSLDMDVVDPLIAPGVGTPVPGGLGYREIQLAMETIGDSGMLKSMDVVEVNPILDTHNQTAVLAVDLVLSAFGKRIY